MFSRLYKQVQLPFIQPSLDTCFSYNDKCLSEQEYNNNTVVLAHSSTLNFCFCISVQNIFSLCAEPDSLFPHPSSLYAKLD